MEIGRLAMCGRMRDAIASYQRARSSLVSAGVESVAGHNTLSGLLIFTPAMSGVCFGGGFTWTIWVFTASDSERSSASCTLEGISRTTDFAGLSSRNALKLA